MYLPQLVLKGPQSWARSQAGIYSPSAAWSRTRSAAGVRGESETGSRHRLRCESRCGSGSRADVRSLSRTQRGW